MKHFFVSVLIVVLAAVSAPAQTPVVSQEIVVTASAVPEATTETPVAATVITREEIAAREARDVVDVLREVPGLAVSRSGSPGKATTIFIRGGSSKQALVLWNGIELNDPYFSGYDLGQMSAAGVEKVEVVRGPFSALYGSEAVSGVVNVLTTPVSSRASADVEAGEQGLLNAAISGALFRDRWNVHAAVESREDDGFAANDDFDSRSALGGASFTPTARTSLGILARYTRYDLGIPRAADPTFTRFVPSPSRRQKGSETQIALPVRYENGVSAFELRVSESRRDERFRDPEGAFGPEFSDTESRIRNARATARVSTAVGAITAGGEYEESHVDAASNFATVEARERSNRSFFIEDRLSIARGAGSFELTAGARYDHFDTFGSEISPRIAGAWVRGSDKFRAAYGESFRAPSIGELYYPWGGNESLGPERSRNAEIGYERFTRAGTLSITLFDSEYEGLIVFGENFTFENIAEARARGVELGASRRYGPLQIEASYTWLDAEDRATGDELLRRPEHSGSLALGYHGSEWSSQLVVLHKGARADVTDLAPFGVVRADAHTTADLVFHYRAGAFRPYVKVENVTDVEYEEVFGYPSGGRRAVVGLRFGM